MHPFQNSILSFRWETTGARRELDLRLTDCLISDSAAAGFQRCAFSARGMVGADIGISYLQRVARRNAALPASLRVDVDGQEIWIVGSFRIGMSQISVDGSLWRISLADEAARFHDGHVANAA